MGMKGFTKGPGIGLLIILLIGIPLSTVAAEPSQVWEVINPEGVVRIEPMKINPHPNTLQGKTVLLRWNGKHNGDRFLKRIGELLAENVRDIRIIRSWEAAPETADPITGSQERSERFAKILAGFKPDIVIGAQAD